MEAWSARFTSLEEKHLELQSEVYQRLQDIQRSVEVLKIDCGAEIDKAEKAFQREMTRKMSVIGS